MPSDISNYLNQIRTAVYGREVREAIADGIEQCYNDTSNGVTLAETKLSELNGAVERLNGAVDNAEANMSEAVSDALESLGDAVESANGAVTTANAAAARAQELNTALGNNADDLVLVQETQPNEEFNKVWVKPTVEEHEVPTYQEFSDLKSAIDTVDDFSTLTVGTNIFSGCTESGAIDNTTGEEYDSAQYVRSGYIPIDASKSTIYGLRQYSGWGMSLFYYDSGKEHISTSSEGSRDQIFKSTGSDPYALRGSSTIPPGAAYFRVYKLADVTSWVMLSYTQENTYVEYTEQRILKDAVVGANNLQDGAVGTNNLNESVKELLGIGTQPVFAENVPHDVLQELYIPNADSTYTLERVVSKITNFALQLTIDGVDQGNIGMGSAQEPVPPDLWDGDIRRLIDLDGNIVGYFVLGYSGTDFSNTSGSIALNLSNVTDINKSPKIKEYLSRTENLVLLGDSIVGYYQRNLLENRLMMLSDKQVFNCAFTGCRMSWRTADGSSPYDLFSFVGVADAVTETITPPQERYHDMLDAINGESVIKTRMWQRYISLKEVDFTKPTHIIVNYVNNDLTSDAVIGDLWAYDAESFDKTTLLGAMNYGIQTLLTKYPHIRLTFMTPVYRNIDNLPPYAYTNTLNKSAMDYGDAITENAGRLGISVFDLLHFSRRNYYNLSEYLQDASHYNAKGFAMFAELLNAVDRGTY